MINFYHNVFQKILLIWLRLRTCLLYRKIYWNLCIKSLVQNNYVVRQPFFITLLIYPNLLKDLELFCFKNRLYQYNIYYIYLFKWIVNRIISLNSCEFHKKTIRTFIYKFFNSYLVLENFNSIFFFPKNLNLNKCSQNCCRRAF